MLVSSFGSFFWHTLGQRVASPYLNIFGLYRLISSKPLKFVVFLVLFASVRHGLLPQGLVRYMHLFIGVAL